MSIMTEALAGLSVAVNVMQVIAFSRDTITTIKRLYDNKPLAPDATINNKSFERLVTTLREDLSSTYSQTQQDKELAMVADQVVELAEQIKEVLQDYPAVLGASRVQRLAKGLGKALRYTLYDKPKVKDLDLKLSKMQDLMLFHILVDLRQRVRAGNLTASTEFSSLDQKVQHFTRRLEIGISEMNHFLGQGFKCLEETEVVTKPRMISTSDAQVTIAASTYIPTQTQSKVQRSHGNQPATFSDFDSERLLQSLQFPGMHARARALDSRPAHQGTFEWVYGAHASNDESYSVPWDDFPQWLQSDEPIYWISGKPGAGKSTFTRFLINDARTHELLKARGDVCIISAFIWAAGSHMQRSLQGLLCVLLHALLTQRPPLMRCSRLDERIYHKTCPEDWSHQDLEYTFRSLIQSRAQPVCIFIDGLDEIDSSLLNGQDNLLDLISRLSVIDGIKLCLSSRPEVMLETQLRRYPHMELQSLTEGDIHRLITDQLDTPEVISWIQSQQEKCESTQRRHENCQPMLEHLVTTVTQRAQGIFLWVCLVTQSIRRGIARCDDWNLLLKRINSLPSELEKLYEDLWQRQQEDADIYRVPVAVYLNTILDLRWYSVTALHMLFVVEPLLCRRLLAGGSYVSSVEIHRRMHELRQQIDARCCGLVEFRAESDFSSTQSPDLMTEEEATRRLYYSALAERPISLVHRSALDFLITTKKGQEIRSYDQRTRMESESANFLAELSRRVLVDQKEWMHIVSLRIDQLYGSFCFDTPSFSTPSTRLSSLKLCQASLDRLYQDKDHPDLILCSPDRSGQQDAATNMTSRNHSSSTKDVNQVYLKLLRSSLNTLWFYGNADCDALARMGQLLKHGANPNTIVASRPGTHEMHLPPLAACLYRAWLNGMTSQIDTHALGKVLNTLFDHGLNYKARFLGSEGPGSHLLTFARVFQNIRGTEPTEICSGRSAVLYDMDYAHFLSVLFKDSLPTDLSGTEGWKLMAELLQQRISCRPQGIMLVQADIRARKVTSLSAKLIVAHHSDCVLEHATSKPNGMTTLYESYPGEIMNEEAIVRWLVEHQYMSPGVLHVKDPLSILVKDLYSANYSAEPQNRSAVDFSYRPEYDNFIKAIDERNRRELAGV